MITSDLCDLVSVSLLWLLLWRRRWTTLQFPFSWAEPMDCRPAACHQLVLKGNKCTTQTVLFVCVSQFRQQWNSSNTCWVRLQRRVLLRFRLIKWQQLTVGLLTLLTAEHKGQNKDVKKTTNRPVIHEHCSKQVGHTDRGADWCRPISEDQLQGRAVGLQSV